MAGTSGRDSEVTGVGRRLVAPGLAGVAVLAALAGAGGPASLLLLAAIVAGAVRLLDAVGAAAEGRSDRFPVAMSAAAVVCARHGRGRARRAARSRRCSSAPRSSSSASSPSSRSSCPRPRPPVLRSAILLGTLALAVTFSGAGPRRRLVVDSGSPLPDRPASSPAAPRCSRARGVPAVQRPAPAPTAPPGELPLRLGDRDADVRDRTVPAGLRERPGFDPQGAPVLPYGSTWRHYRFVCTTAPSGVTCRNADGHGWFMSARHWRRL